MITLITADTKELGFATARRRIDLGHKAYIGARNAALGEAAASKLKACFACIDVTQDASVNAAV